MKIPQEAKDKLAPWFTVRELDQARITLVPCLPPNVWAMTFGNRILIRRDKWSLEIDNIARIGHELVHSRQYRKMGWKRHLDKFTIEGVSLLTGVPDPLAAEYDSTATEDLLALDIVTITQAEIKAKMKVIQDKLKAGNV